MESEKLIQIIGYRKGHDSQSGKPFIWQKHFSHIKITSVLKLFENLDSIVEAIPEGERYDIHYTNANCQALKDDKSIPLRLFGYQEMIPVDLDDIDLSKRNEYIEIVVRMLGLDISKTGIYCSGHGLHFVIALTQPIESGEELHKLQRYYSALMNKMSMEFFQSGLCGKADPIRLAESATLRLPKTLNTKEADHHVMSYVISNNVQPQPFYLDSLIDLPEEEELKLSTRAVDTKAVLSGCGFLKYVLENPKSVDEPMWYASLSTLVFIPETGINLCHTYSSQHPDYSYEETQAKAEQALGFGKARTCDSIGQVYKGCAQCPHYGKVKTPLSIKGDEFIGTEASGFHDVIDKQDGSAIKSIPNYGDLRKFFIKKNTFVVNKQSRQVSIFKTTHWENYTDLEIEAFATNHFMPLATINKRAEFKSLVFATNLVDNTFFGKDNSGHVNFKNGVLRLADNALLPHSPDFGFNYVLKYDYNKNAKCPEFDKMMDNITVKDKDTQRLLLEYMAYAISGMRASYGAKALILTGGGSNGKSTFLNVIKELVGSDCFSTVTLESMNDANNRYSMANKLFNICEEVEESELKRGTAIFKSIVTGANMMVKKLYSDTVSMRIDTKLILSCNELPSSKENTYAIYRRMLIVPFKAKFDKNSGIDKGIEDRIFKEMSGVYNRILDAYAGFIANEGAFSESDSSAKALADYKYNNSMFNQFVDSCLVKGGTTDMMATDELMMAYNTWAQLNNVLLRPTSNKLIKELKTIGIIPDEATIKSIGGTTKRVYLGVKKANTGAF